jgi:hypothetical protein
LPACRAQRGARERTGDRSRTDSRHDLPEAGKRKPQEVSMTNKSKYAGFGIAVGAVLGAVFGIIAGHVGVWLAVGVAIGVAIGASLRGKKTDCPQCASLHQSHSAMQRRSS